MSRIISVIYCLLFSAICRAQSYPPRPDAWKVYPLPVSRDTLLRYNNSGIDWVVYEQDGQVAVMAGRDNPVVTGLPFVIKPMDEIEKWNMRGKIAVLKVDDGYLVAFWKGEWGGYLYWFDNKGKKRYLVSNDMILQFMERGGRIYALEGLSHMGSSHGSIRVLQKQNERWVTGEFIKLPFAPRTAAYDSDSNMVVVTSHNLISVSKEGKINTLSSDLLWQYLYPNTIVIRSTIAFIGMRKGVLKVDLMTQNLQWLLPD